MGRWWRPFGIDLVTYKVRIYYGCLVLVSYIICYYYYPFDFLFWDLLSFHVITYRCFHENLHKLFIIFYMLIEVHLKHQFGIWVQSRKENQILRLNLNLYWVILKLRTFSWWLWDPDFTCSGFFMERVLGVVPYDVRGASPHQLVSGVVS
jgi:hypothetical protein